MIKKVARKWKTITVYDDNAKQVIQFQLDENEKLIQKIHNQKRIPNIIKEISSKKDQKYQCNLNGLPCKERKMEISKHTMIFVRETNLDQNTNEILSNEILSKEEIKLHLNDDDCQIMDLEKLELTM